MSIEHEAGRWFPPAEEIGFGNPSIGLQSIGVLKGISNPGISVSSTDMWGMIIGGGLGWYISSKWPNMVVKYVGVVVGAELGILVARMINPIGRKI